MKNVWEGEGFGRNLTQSRKHSGFGRCGSSKLGQRSPQWVDKESFRVKKHNHHHWLILTGIWFLAALGDRLWFALDRSIPAWDQADYLTGALNYWQALQNPQWGFGEWWTDLWLLSSKIPPGTYLVTAIVHNFFGIGGDRATLVHLFFSAILLASVYGLGKLLFNPKIGLWAAFLCVLFPGLYQVRLDFLLDYPLTATVTLSLYCLTGWKLTETAKQRKTPHPQSDITPNSSVDSSKKTGDTLNIKSASPETDVREFHTISLKLFRLIRQKISNFIPKRNSRWRGNDRGNGEEKREKATGKLPLRPWIWAAGFGVSFGVALMVKQTAVLFLCIPLLWVGVETLYRRQWGRVVQLAAGVCLSALTIYPWYRTNWLLVLTGSKRATVDAAIAEGDPALNTLGAWTFYLKQLPHQISWPILMVSLLGFACAFVRYRQANRTYSPESDRPLASISRASWRWIGVFLLGSYLLCSLNINKDFRYVLPYLPVVALVVAAGLMGYDRRWGRYVRWGTATAAIAIAMANLWPTSELLAPQPGAHHAYIGAPWPHEAAIGEILETAPHLRSTLGVLPSTPGINQHNFNYYGNLANFQVYGRQVGTRNSHVRQDARSLDWFVTKTGNQGSVGEAQAAIVQRIKTGGEFQLRESWELPDGSVLELYHRQNPPVRVEAIAPPSQGRKVQLDRVSIPAQSPAGVPVSVTYQWSGDWAELRQGIVLLTWRRLGVAGETGARDRWFHDRGIGGGELRSSAPPAHAKVIDRTAMLPPGDVTPGDYTLVARYLNRNTGESYPISVPSVRLTVDPNAIASPAPELDWVTQLRSLSAALPLGPDALGSVFDEIGRINQYDPIQDYLNQAQRSLEYRLQREPQNLEFAYNLALANVLRRDAKGAIEALQTVVQLDPQNPFAHAYLAFVYLYDWQPREAEIALESARALAPEQLEIQLLGGVAALMQGNLVQLWHRLHQFVPSGIQTLLFAVVIVIMVLLSAVLLWWGIKSRR